MEGNEPFPATVIFGANGFMGRNLLRSDFSGGRSLGISRNDLDLARPDIRSLHLSRKGITHAVIAAAISRIADCERDPDSTRRVNIQGTVELARQLAAERIKIIVFSSDYVFDGSTGRYTEDSPVAPANEYGRQKADMERLLLKTCGESVLILRLSKVFDLIRGERHFTR